MKKLLSLFLVLVTILGILSTGASAADSVEAALGEVNIYNGDYELAYLSINGAVKKQDYTYFLYESNDGTTKESPAYCVNPTIPGVPQTVGPGESIKYLAEEKASDPKVVGIISNGYPHRSLGELGLDNKYQAYYATKMALWCYLLPNWNIANLKVAPGLTGTELDIGNRILAAAKDIYKRGTTYNYSKRRHQRHLCYHFQPQRSRDPLSDGDLPVAGQRLSCRGLCDELHRRTCGCVLCGRGGLGRGERSDPGHHFHYL